MASLRYTHAVVCRIPLSLRTRGEIELEEAKKQHEAYVRLLRELGLDVIELPPDEALPECVFVEDTAIICNGIALITKPGAPQRAKEVFTYYTIRFHSSQFLLKIRSFSFVPNIINFNRLNSFKTHFKNEL